MSRFSFDVFVKIPMLRLHERDLCTGVDGGSGTLIVKEMLLPASGKSTWESYAGSGAASKQMLGGTLQVDRR
jgi:hypothetical protein